MSDFLVVSNISMYDIVWGMKCVWFQWMVMIVLRMPKHAWSSCDGK